MPVFFIFWGISDILPVHLNLPECGERRGIIALDKLIQRQRAHAVLAQLHALRAVPALQREGLAKAVVQRHRAGNPIRVVRKIRAQLQRQRVDFHLAAKVERQLRVRPRADAPAAKRPFAVAAGDVFAVACG